MLKPYKIMTQQIALHLPMPMILMPLAPLAYWKPLSGQWTDNEVKLLLDFVERNCTLMTTQGTNLMKSDFNKAHTLVKLNDASQCHYKWRHVSFFIIAM